MLSADQFSDVILNETLYLIPDAANVTKPEVLSNSDTPWKGSRQSGLAIILDTPEKSFGADENDRLERLLQAIGIPRKNALLRFIGDQVTDTIQQELAEAGAVSLLLFTERPEAFNWLIPEYYKVLKDNTLSYIISHNISGFTIERRTALWNALKQMYQIT